MEKVKKIPLYLQLVKALETKIRETMSPNQKLQSERELIQAYDVSRMTVRLALQDLEKRGVIYKKQGKGTFVSEIVEPACDLSTAYSFTEQMKRIGKDPQTKILSFRKIQLDTYLAKDMGMEVGEEAWELERLRLADGLEMMLERSYLPYKEFSTLTKIMLEKKPLYDIFAEDFKQTIRVAEEEFYASVAMEMESDLLKIPLGSAVLHLQRKTYTDKNQLIEYTFSIARADQFRYRISHLRQGDKT